MKRFLLFFSLFFVFGVQAAQKPQTTVIERDGAALVPVVPVFSAAGQQHAVSVAPQAPVVPNLTTRTESNHSLSISSNSAQAGSSFSIRGSAPVVPDHTADITRLRARVSRLERNQKRVAEERKRCNERYGDCCNYCCRIAMVGGLVTFIYFIAQAIKDTNNHPQPPIATLNNSSSTGMFVNETSFQMPFMLPEAASQELHNNTLGLRHRKVHKKK